MHLDLQWQTNPRATILHALRRLADDKPVIDHAVVSKLEQWATTLRDFGLKDEFWGQLLPIASRDAELSLLVDEAARRSQLNAPANEVARVFEAAEKQIASSDLDVAEELRLRQRPLRELWEASGPGMLWQIGRWTMQPILPRIEVDGLLPLCGGFGQAFSQAERVQIELVLTNPTAEVPEVIRLAWLIAQLSIPSDSNVAVDRLALVPCCLAAAEQLGLAQCQPSSLVKSLRGWTGMGQRENELAVALDQWWNDRDEDAPWSQVTATLRDLLMTDDALG